MHPSGAADVLRTYRRAAGCDGKHHVSAFSNLLQQFVQVFQSCLGRSASQLLNSIVLTSIFVVSISIRLTLARIFVVSTSISAPPNHPPAPCCVECQSIENQVFKDLRRADPGEGFSSLPVIQAGTTGINPIMTVLYT